MEPPPPGVAQYDLDHCHVGDYNLGSCGTSMSDICYFFAERHGEISESVVFHSFWVSCLFLGFVCCVLLCLVFVLVL